MKPEDVPQELVDIFAHKFWPFPFGQHEEPQSATRQALAPVLVEHKKQLRAERDALKAELAATLKTAMGLAEDRFEVLVELAEARAAIERLTAERVKAEHFACRPYRCGDEASGMDGKERCHGCRRVWPCPTIAALDAPRRPEDTRCPARCDEDCETGPNHCAEVHTVRWQRSHEPENCPSARPEDTREETGQ